MPDPRPGGGRFFVRVEQYSCDEVTEGQSDVARVFAVAFGPAYRSLLRRSLGDRLWIAEMRPRGNDSDLAGIYPFSDAAVVLSWWAGWVTPDAPAWAARLRSGRAVVMDFAAIAPHWRGSALPCLHAAWDALASRGASGVVAEVQWLRQLLFWRRCGWQVLTPLTRDPVRTWRDVTRALREGRPIEALLGKGEELIWHDEPYYDGTSRWNVVLERPVYLARDLQVRRPAPCE